MPNNYSPTLNHYSGQGAFRFWCQKVLPLVYDDSLSYYELLNSVVNYLNNVITDVSTMGGNIDALLGAYEQLQDYVNDYFDNLDVQQEINEKLDEMATSGQLSSIVAPTIAEVVTDWLEEYTDPVGSAVMVDSSLTISGAAADAKATGDGIKANSDSISTIENEVLIDELYDFSIVGGASTLLGFQTGYFDDSGEPHGSNYFLRTSASNKIDISGVKKIKLIPPTGYGISICIYNSELEFITKLGDANTNTNPACINQVVEFICGENYVFAKITVGRFNSGDSGTYAQNEEFINQIKLHRYYSKTEEIDFDLAIIEENVYDLANIESTEYMFIQGGYARTGAALGNPQKNYYISTADYINNLLFIKVIGNYSVTVFAWDSGGSFAGFVTTDDTITSNRYAETKKFKELNIKKLTEKYPNLLFKLQVTNDLTVAGTSTDIYPNESRYVYAGTIYAIQPYYVNELIKTITDVKSKITEPALVFPLVTDIHYLQVNSSFDRCVQNIAAFCKEVSCDFIVNLGDYTDGDTEHDVTIARCNHILEKFNEMNENYLATVGNHDTNYKATLFNASQIFQTVLSNTKNVVYDLANNGENYYVDFDNLGIRVVFIDSNHNGQYAYSQTTANWLSGEALVTTNIVVLFSHMSEVPSMNYAAQPVDYHAGVENAINSFVNNGGTVIEFCGHDHADLHFTSPHLTIFNCCQLCKQSDINSENYAAITGYVGNIEIPARTAFTETEDCWSVVVVKPISRTINVVRFGAGNDRNFSF